uniref:Uncharacterized protein n=1 Tax=Candidatus Methanogaster sp. ANME-2c ERB4 TaxID=2759911 RepID=A0A7G9Y820_9EURY|nr:hypothetical protein ELINAKEJ_00001 [Methanosarcinales archaeon ANME-2c ERB4]QNO44154.1 hypothetical protein MIPKNKFN_00001 [Methanosarcinales archaeon ANME-2c ERB4]
MDKGHGHYPVPRFGEYSLRLFICSISRLHIKEARNDLEIVLYPVVYLPEHHLFLL